MYPCERCEFQAASYNALIEHGQRQHGDKQVDPGNEFSSPSAKKLDGIIAWLRKQPDANLKTGEGKLLLDEIDRLAGKLIVAENDIKLGRCPHNEVKLYLDFRGPQKIVCAICDMPIAKDAIHIL